MEKPSGPAPGQGLSVSSDSKSKAEKGPHWQARSGPACCGGFLQSPANSPPITLSWSHHHLWLCRASTWVRSTHGGGADALHQQEGRGSHSIPTFLCQPEYQLLRALPEDSLGACHSAGLGKRKSSLGTKVPLSSFSTYLTDGEYLHET